MDRKMIDRTRAQQLQNHVYLFALGVEETDTPLLRVLLALGIPRHGCRRRYDPKNGVQQALQNIVDEK